jgi:hypothetical protein
LQIFARAFHEKQAREELRNVIGRKGFVQAILGFGSQPASSTANPTASLAQPRASTPPTPDIRIIAS